MLTIYPSEASDVATSNLNILQISDVQEFSLVSFIARVPTITNGEYRVEENWPMPSVITDRDSR